MSRIPQTLSNFKENKPGLLNRRPVGKNLTKILSDAEKTELLANHTKPMKTVSTTASISSTRTQFKRSVTLPAPGSRITKPVVTKPEVKTVSTVQRSGPNRDFMFYKTHYNELLEKHRVVKSELTDLKDKQEEFSDEYEKIKESALNSANERDVLKEKLLSALKELKERSAEYDKLRIDCELQKHENEELIRKMKVLQDIADNFKIKSMEFDSLKAEFEVLNRRHNNLKEETEALRTLNEHLKRISVEHDNLKIEHVHAQKKIAQNTVELEDLQSMLATMYKEQRDLRNTVQDLKGNIRVYCRIRPPLDSESSRPLFNLNVLDACSIEVEKVELNSVGLSSRKGRQQQSFTFDGIFTPHTSQEDVFAEVSSMIQSALDGYNVCIFAYGQTGSGKTYTMEGGCGSEQYGIIPRAFNMIFACMNDLKKVGWELTVRVSFLEIYNEIIYDLLDPCKDQESHDIKMVNSKGTDVYVSNLKEEEVKSSHDFIKLMIVAQRNRQTAATLNNERSSRSHAVTQIKISAINDKRKEKFTSNLNLVDLAGSESGKFSQRMDETKHINRSLSELSKVILSLQTNQAHIPYRNSKLTHLLMPSLGGNSKTLMLVNVNQFDECFGETLNSLRFATKVNNCRTVKAKKNITMVDS